MIDTLTAPTRLFLHYLDVHFLESKSIRTEQRLFDEARLATRIALITATEGLYIPASSYFESDIAHRVLGEFFELYHTGLIILVGGGFSLDEFVEEKLLQYRQQSAQYKAYSARGVTPEPPFHTRRRSATADIRADWLATLRGGSVASMLGSGIALWHPPLDIEHRWESAVADLGNLAFTVEHIHPLLFPEGAPPQVRNRLHAVVDGSYFKSYLNEYRYGIVRDLVYLDAPYLIDSWTADISYRRMREQLRTHGLLSQVESAAPPSLLQLRDNPLVILARSRCTLPPRYRGGTDMYSDNDVIRTLAIQFSSREEAQFVWRTAGGRDSDVPLVSDVETMWARLWQRAELGAPVTKEALVAEAMRKYPRNATLIRWCQAHSNPDVRRAIAIVLDQATVGQRSSLGQLLEQVLDPIPDLTAHAVEVASVAALADIPEERKGGILKSLVETGKAASLGAWKATVEAAVKALVASATQ